MPKSIDEDINEEEDYSLLYNDIDVLHDLDTTLENSKQCNKKVIYCNNFRTVEIFPSTVASIIIGHKSDTIDIFNIMIDKICFYSEEITP